MKAQRVKIAWIDSTSNYDGWVSKKEMAKEFKCLTIKTSGYVIRERKQEIVIAHSVSEGGSVLGVITIPKGCIKSIKRYKDRT